MLTLDEKKFIREKAFDTLFQGIIAPTSEPRIFPQPQNTVVVATYAKMATMTDEQIRTAISAYKTKYNAQIEAQKAQLEKRKLT